MTRGKFLLSLGALLTAPFLPRPKVSNIRHIEPRWRYPDNLPWNWGPSPGTAVYQLDCGNGKYEYKTQDGLWVSDNGEWLRVMQDCPKGVGS